MSFIKVKDERLNFESVDDAKFAVYSAPKMNVSVIPPQNLPGVGAGVNYLSYLLNNVGPNVGRSKLLWVNLQASFNVVGTNLPTTADGYNSYVGFKCFPINRNVTSVQHVLNESTETYLTYQLIDWLSRLRQDADRIDFYENLYQDCIINYNSAQGSNINPVTNYTSATLGEGTYKPRVLGLTVNAISNTQATFTVNIWEPLFTPFSGIPNKGMDIPALWNITSENLQINILNNFGDMFAVAFPQTGGNPTITSISLNQINSCNLYVNYLTGLPESVPMKSLTQFPKFQRFATSIGNIAPNGQSSATVNINSSTMPSLIALMVKPNESSRTFTTGDYYAQITGVQAQLDNGDIILNTYSTKNLYQMSRQNGLTDGWFQFNQQNLLAVTANGACYGSGSVIFINPAKDLNLGSSRTNCSQGKYTLTFTVQFNNPCSAGTGFTMNNMSLVAYCVNDAILSRDGTTYSTAILTYSDEEVRSATREADHVEYTEFFDSKYNNLILSGGGLFSKLKKHIKSAWAHRKQIMDVAKKGYELGKSAHSAYKTYKGSGDDLQMYYD